VSALVGTLLEAWGEVRVHRARVVLSLVGVFLAVFAMTIVTAAGDMGRQALLESAERGSGRSTTVSVNASSPDGTATAEEVGAAYAALVDRFGITWSSTLGYGQLELRVGQALVPTSLQVVDPDYGVIHRIVPSSGRWLTASDADRLAPALVVNEAFREQTGTSGLVPPYAVEVPGSPAVTTTVVGVVDSAPWGPQAFVLPSAAALLPGAGAGGGTPSLEVWLPPQEVDAFVAQVPAVLARSGLDGGAAPVGDGGVLRVMGYVQWGIRGLSLFALALGAVGVLNVGIVTVRQRIREIGVRRALGASSARVFAAIMLESVVATALAGALGVALAVAIVVNLPLELVTDDLGISEVPPFPVAAALEAFLSATAVGALVGLVPATIAVRSRVIDAIRY